MTIPEGNLTLEWLGADRVEFLDLLRCCLSREEWDGPAISRFLACPYQTNTIKVLVNEAGTVFGTLFYTLNAASLRVRRIAVWPDFRRRGLGTFMLQYLIGETSPLAKRQATVWLREDKTEAVSFFAANGFAPVDRTDDGRAIYAFQKPALETLHVGHDRGQT